MADFNLEALSLSELKKLPQGRRQGDLHLSNRQKAEARAKVEAFARELGYPLAELVGGDTKPKRAPVAAKYRHPENPSLTWSGRGRKPQWFVDALAGGKMAEDLALG